jgi:hypothetical protein
MVMRPVNEVGSDASRVRMTVSPGWTPFPPHGILASPAKALPIVDPFAGNVTLLPSGRTYHVAHIALELISENETAATTTHNVLFSFMITLLIVMFAPLRCMH